MKTIIKFVKKIIRPIRVFLNYTITIAIKFVASFRWTRSVLNYFYNNLSLNQKKRFHNKFAKIFRSTPTKINDGIWSIYFNGTRINMPITNKRMWLDWDSAISIIGHDTEVKETYAKLMSQKKIDLFIDIGGNYGTHSLLFLANKIETLTFEPNSSCHSYFEEICRLNSVSPSLKHIAISDKNGTATLAYPPDETWLGSISETVTENIKNKKLKTETVEKKPIDDFIQIMVNKNVVFKIDTEGNELAVLKGASRILSEIKPFIIFECFKGPEREELFDYIESKKYSIYGLPYSTSINVSPLSKPMFLTSKETNFAAKTT